MILTKGKKKSLELYRSLTSRVNPTPIIVLGHQKSGTTAIASLLGKHANKSVVIDPFFRMKDQVEIRRSLFSKKTTIQKIVQKNKYYFSFDIIKDPNFSFLFDEIHACFPDAKFVFIVRDPRDNIRSILDRLKLTGNLESLNSHHMENISLPWQLIVNGELPSVPGINYVEKLAHRWVISSEQYIKYKNKIILVKYEDFVRNKVHSINSLAQQVGIESQTDISDYVDTQFQPRGQQNVDWQVFFGLENLKKIESICQKTMAFFDYH